MFVFLRVWSLLSDTWLYEILRGYDSVLLGDKNPAPGCRVPVAWSD